MESFLGVSKTFSCDVVKTLSGMFMQPLYNLSPQILLVLVAFAVLGLVYNLLNLVSQEDQSHYLYEKHHLSQASLHGHRQ